MSKLILPFGDYLPDLPPDKNPGLTVAKNCLPYKKNYIPFGSAIDGTAGALPSTIVGYFSSYGEAGIRIGFAGTSSDLYGFSYSGLSATWASTTRTLSAYNATVSELGWEFLQWGDQILATDYNDPIQMINVNNFTLTQFTALSGSPPHARQFAIVKNFLVLGAVSDVTASGAFVPSQIHWSGFNNITTWTPSLTTQCDYQKLNHTRGYIKKIIGGEYGLIFQEFAISRMTYVGSPVVFQIDEIEPGKGTPSSRSVIQQGQLVFYLGHDDFYVFSGGISTPIGGDRIYKTFRETLIDQTSNYPEIFVGGIAHPSLPIVFWTYPGLSSGGKYANYMLAYNWHEQRWSGPIDLGTTYEIMGLHNPLTHNHHL